MDSDSRVELDFDFAQEFELADSSEVESDSQAEVGLDFEFDSGTNFALDFAVDLDSQPAVELESRLEQGLLVPEIRGQQNSKRTGSVGLESDSQFGVEPGNHLAGDFHADPSDPRLVDSHSVYSEHANHVCDRG